MRTMILLATLVVAYKLLALLVHVGLPWTRRAVHDATRNDWAWLATWAMVAGAVGTATAMAHARGLLG